jgi:hypothetical protein
MKNQNLDRALFRTLLFCAIVLACQSSSYSQASQWYKLRSNFGGFRIEFPRQPSFSSEPKIEGAITYNAYALKAKDYDLLAAFYDFPGKNETELKNQADIFASGYLALIKQTEVSKTEIAQKNCPGTEIQSKGQGRKIATLRIFRSNQRFYLLSFVSTADPQISKAMSEHFFNSFEILDGCKSAEVTN